MRTLVPFILTAAMLVAGASGQSTAPAASQPASTRPATRPAEPTRLDAILAGTAPRTVADLKAMEERFRQLAARVTKATVGIASRGGGGSGVIVSADGYVLTVGHIIREAGRDVTVLLPDGRRARAKTLGANLSVDSGLIKITDKPPDRGGWPHCAMGHSATLKRGQWCLAIGHAGGYRRGRTPPVRVGRILQSTPYAIVSDCTIVSGDSGGPLFDMAGEVIGISSRISGPLDGNIHVPIDVYHRDWQRLVAGDVLGMPRGRGAYLGVMTEDESGKVRIRQVVPGAAAEKAGLRAGDVITRFDGKEVHDSATLVRLIVAKRPGERVRMIVQRDGKSLERVAVLGRREG